MPRRRPPRDVPDPRRRESRSVEEIRRALFGPSGEPVEGFTVNVVSGSDKTYTCPYCSGVIAPRLKHVVAIPDGRVDERRHYHSGCWTKRSVRRSPGGH